MLVLANPIYAVEFFATASSASLREGLCSLTVISAPEALPWPTWATSWAPADPVGLLFLLATVYTNYLGQGAMALKALHAIIDNDAGPELVLRQVQPRRSCAAGDLASLHTIIASAR